MIQKNHFWIGAKGGLLDRKHYLAMREAIWLFLYFLLTQTAMNPAGEGVVNYGHPINLKRIARDLNGIPVRTIKRWVAKLRTENYIRTEGHSNKGLKVWILKAKSKTKSRKIHKESKSNLRPDVALSLVHSGPDVAPSQIANRPDPIDPSANARSSNASISKGLSYYNSAAAAESAAEPLRLVKNLARQKTMPGGMTAAQVQERWRLLLEQAESVEAIQ